MALAAARRANVSFTAFPGYRFYRRIVMDLINCNLYEDKVLKPLRLYKTQIYPSKEVWPPSTAHTYPSCTLYYSSVYGSFL